MFKSPVYEVKSIPIEKIQANAYNPNSVAPPEMKLLYQSIKEDGYTMPIVCYYLADIDKYEIVDGYHRNRVGKEYEDINKRIKGYLPVVVINNDRNSRGDRIASTIRHNRARGKHTIEGMSDIVLELKKRNWSNERISKKLGMDADEILRFTQITGLAEMFANKEFSEAWEADINDDIGGTING